MNDQQDPTTALTLEQRIRKILEEYGDFGGVGINDSLMEACPMDYDDLTRVEVVMQIEMDFKIEVSDDELDRVATIADLMALVDPGTRSQDDPSKGPVIMDIDSRWEKGIPHRAETLTLFKELRIVDNLQVEPYFNWKCGGDGDNGELLMYALDIVFEQRERTQHVPISS